MAINFDLGHGFDLLYHVFNQPFLGNWWADCNGTGNQFIGYSAGEFQALQLIVLAVFGVVD